MAIDATRSAGDLIVDWALCEGHGVCSAAFGEAIGLDRWGYPVGPTGRGMRVQPRDLPAARLAVATCPMAALRLARRTA